jgi:hypothetical protein
MPFQKRFFFPHPVNIWPAVFDNHDTGEVHTMQKPELRENAWYSAYHVASNRMVSVKLVGVTDKGMQFEDRERRLYSNREFYFWKTTQ